MLLPRRTVRMRLTALYCGLFLVSAVALLAITNGIGSQSTGVARMTGPRSDQTVQVVSHSMALPSSYLVGSLIALGVMTVVSILVAWIVSGRILRPVRVITETTKRISADNLDERLAMAGPEDELKRLSDTIDGLLARLDTAFAAQRRFVANASHELRTPLATARALVDVASAKPGRVAPETTALSGRVRDELDKVDLLLDALLALARTQHGALPDRMPMSLAAAVSASLNSHIDDLAARNLDVQQVIVSDALWLVANPPLLSRVVDNLVENAIVHNEDGGWIRLTATRNASSALVTVENGGDMLDQSEVDSLAQPFRRIGRDRTNSDRGAGLGLSIVRAVTEAHGGQLTLRARPDGGLAATIELPIPTRPVRVSDRSKASL